MDHEILKKLIDNYTIGCTDTVKLLAYADNLLAKHGIPKSSTDWTDVYSHAAYRASMIASQNTVKEALAQPSVDLNIQKMSIKELAGLLDSIAPAEGTNVFQKVQEALAEKMAVEMAGAPVHGTNAHVHEWFHVSGDIEGCVCGAYRNYLSLVDKKDSLLKHVSQKMTGKLKDPLFGMGKTEYEPFVPKPDNTMTIGPSQDAVTMKGILKAYEELNAINEPLKPKADASYDIGENSLDKLKAIAAANGSPLIIDEVGEVSGEDWNEMTKPPIYDGEDVHGLGSNLKFLLLNHSSSNFPGCHMSVNPYVAKNGRLYADILFALKSNDSKVDPEKVVLQLEDALYLPVDMRVGNLKDGTPTVVVQVEVNRPASMAWKQTVSKGRAHVFKLIGQLVDAHGPHCFGPNAGTWAAQPAKEPKPFAKGDLGKLESNQTTFEDEMNAGKSETVLKLEQQLLIDFSDIDIGDGPDFSCFANVAPMSNGSYVAMLMFRFKPQHDTLDPYSVLKKLVDCGYLPVSVSGGKQGVDGKSFVTFRAQIVAQQPGANTQKKIYKAAHKVLEDVNQLVAKLGSAYFGVVNAEDFEQVALPKDSPEVKIGVDIGKPGGDKTVVACILDNKVSFHMVAPAYKDALVEVDGKLFVPTGMHVEENTFTLVAQKLTDAIVGAACVKAVNKAIDEGILADVVSMEKVSLLKGKWTAKEVVMPGVVNELALDKIMNDGIVDDLIGEKMVKPGVTVEANFKEFSPNNQKQFICDDTLSMGSTVYLSGAGTVTGFPKPGQVISVGKVAHSVLKGEKVWVNVTALPSGAIQMTEEHLKGPKFAAGDEKTSIVEVKYEEVQSTAGIESFTKECWFGTLMVIPQNANVYAVKLVTKEGLAMSVSTFLMGPGAVVRARRAVNVDGSQTYFVEHQPVKGGGWEVLSTQQVGSHKETVSSIKGKYNDKIYGNVENGLKLQEQVIKAPGDCNSFVFYTPPNGRKIMEITTDGKIVVHGDTFFTLNDKTLQPLAKEFAKEFWAAVEKMNPAYAKTAGLMKEVQSTWAAYKGAQQEIHKLSGIIEAIKAEGMKLNHDQTQEPSRARFLNVTRMLDFPDMPEAAE